MRSIFSTLPFLLVGGCASISTEMPRPLQYLCDQGNSFSVTFLPFGAGAVIDIQDMRVSLEEAASPGPVQRYYSQILTLWREGERVRVFMQGASLYNNCRLRE